MELRQTLIRFGLVASIGGSALLLGACRGPGSGGDEAAASPTATARVQTTTARSVNTTRTAANTAGTTAPAVTTTTAAQSTPTPRQGTVPGERYVVQRGDTLVDIAERYGVTVAEIIQANNLENPDVLNVGQELIIPTR